MNSSDKQLDASNSFEGALEIIENLSSLFGKNESIDFENGAFNKLGETSYTFGSDDGESNFSITKNNNGRYILKVGDYTISIDTELDKCYKIQFNKPYFHNLEANNSQSNQLTRRKRRRHPEKFFKCDFSYTIDYSPNGKIVTDYYGYDTEVNIAIKINSETYGETNLNPYIRLTYNELGVLEPEFSYDHSNRINYIEVNDRVVESDNTEFGEELKQIPLRYNLKDNILRLNLPFIDTQVFDFNTFPEGSDITSIVKSVLSTMGKRIDNSEVTINHVTGKVDDVL